MPPRARRPAAGDTTRPPATIEGVPKYRLGRELAMLADGPYAYCWYWRDELEAQIELARTNLTAGYPLGACQKAGYHPTDEMTPNPSPDPKLHGVLGRVWRWKAVSAPRTLRNAA